MPYSEVTITGYNSNPPDDDGSQTTDNEVTWAKHKTKLGDPLKTALETTQTNITTAINALDAEMTAVEAVTEDPVIVGLAGLTPDGNDVPVLGPSAVATTWAALDEDDMASDSATGFPSQQSTKAYVDNRTGDWAHYQHQNASGSDGATHAQNSWVKRLLDVEAYDSVSGSLASNVITLPAGTYVFWAWCGVQWLESEPGQLAIKLIARLRDTTNSATLGRGYGSGGSSGAAVADNTNGVDIAQLNGIFTIAGSTDIELQSYMDTEGKTLTTCIHGHAASTGEVEVYADVMFWKIG